jgi:hypothetical protein
MIAYMSDPNNQNAAQFYRLPDGQTIVVIESLEGNPLSALVRRIDGEREGTLAICRVSNLQRVSVASRLSTSRSTRRNSFA